MDPDPNGRSRAPAQGDPSGFPRVDDQLVRPETREELVRGRAVMAAPAKEPHAERQAEVVYVARSATAKGYVSATELLTRSGPGSDFATDACIRREGTDPTTGARYLEELAFEVVSEQSRRDVTERAEDLSARGVRRVVAIFVKTAEVCEWSSERGDWVVLDPAGVLEDPALTEPIPIAALLDRAEADRTVVRALRAKNNPELAAIEASALHKGLHKGIVALCDVLGIELDPERHTQLAGLDVAGLERLLEALRAERRWPSSQPSRAPR